ncbi:site-specific integrase [uncultured Microbulbifer sp.]|uniref:tyrosine-type recombinase/integrase n=1 Tax=uncultured Microbulbifer sp. TaxID=348147 RepID=UPI00261B71F7|nr:site-specific integrase [uncultured Microbulbifer sp.]
MSKQVARHNITDELYVYQQANSARWYARFSLFGQWHTKATKKKDLNDAIAAAHQLVAEYRLKLEHNIPIKTKRFKNVAELAIKRMLAELENGTGRQIYKDYIGALNKYHIPYFDRLNITSIDYQKLLEFDAWRIEQMKRVPAKSTLLNHNAALMRVFEEAQLNNWILPIQIPKLSAAKGSDGQRKAAFSKEEYYILRYAILSFISNARTQKTWMIREMLQDYMDIAVYTGIRPGTEMENLTWGDLSLKQQHDKVVFYITVRKGKTTKHTGARRVVCREEVLWAIERLRERFPNRKPKDLLFQLEDGTTTSETSRAFDKLLIENELKESPGGKRTLYSLRHTYITWQLMNKVPAQIIAKQCGTSIQMLEQHYSHVMPEMFTEELSGVSFDEEDPVKLIMQDSEEEKAQTAKDTAKWISEWGAEVKKRGCL